MEEQEQRKQGNHKSERSRCSVTVVAGIKGPWILALESLVETRGKELLRQRIDMNALKNLKYGLLIRASSACLLVFSKYSIFWMNE